MEYSNISNRVFSRVRKNGLNEEEVRAFLFDLEKQIKELSEKNQALKEENEEYQQRENSLAKVLITAQENAQKLVSDAEAEANSIIEKANIDAEALSADAKMAADRTLESADVDAKNLLEKTENEVNKEIEKLKHLKEVEKQIRAKIVAALKDSLTSFDSEFPTEELWKDVNIDDETSLFSEDENSIDLSKIYKDLPNTEDELIKLIDTL